MNNVLILLDNPDDWKPYCETKSILTVSDYLKNKPVEKDRKLVINLSNDYSYNSEGITVRCLPRREDNGWFPMLTSSTNWRRGQESAWTEVCRRCVINGFRRTGSKVISGIWISISGNAVRKAGKSGPLHFRELSLPFVESRSEHSSQESDWKYSVLAFEPVGWRGTGLLCQYAG